MARAWGFAIAICLLPVLIVFACFGQIERGFAVYGVCGVFAALIYAKRRVATKPYFILTCLGLFAAQLAAAMLAPLPKSHWPGMAMMPVAVVDYVIVLLATNLVELTLGKQQGANS